MTALNAFLLLLLLPPSSSLKQLVKDFVDEMSSTVVPIHIRKLLQFICSSVYRFAILSCTCI